MWPGMWTVITGSLPVGVRATLKDTADGYSIHKSRLVLEHSCPAARKW